MIDVKNIKASYFSKRGEIKAIDNVNLKIFDNEILGIAGESGCGKSTFLKILYGYTRPPLRVLSGSVKYEYTDLHGSSLSLGLDDIHKRWWEDISYIPQGSMSVLNPVTRIETQFMDVVKRVNSDKSKSELHQIIVSFLHDLDLPLKVLKAYPHQLSGGMCQRVVIALATFLHPRMILADELTTAVDVVVQRGILSLLINLQKKLKNTLVFVSHDMGVHYQVTNRLAVMYAGKIVEVGKTEDIFTQAYHPYPRILIQSLPRIGDRKDREGIIGAPPDLLNPPGGCRFAPRCPFSMEKCLVDEPLLKEVKLGHFAACHLITDSKNPQGTTL